MNPQAHHYIKVRREVYLVCDIQGDSRYDRLKILGSPSLSYYYPEVLYGVALVNLK